MKNISEEEKKIIHGETESLSRKTDEKIDFLCSLVKNRKNIGLDLIDILDNDIVVKEIHRRAEKRLRESLYSYSGYVQNLFPDAVGGDLPGIAFCLSCWSIKSKI